MTNERNEHDITIRISKDDNKIIEQYAGFFHMTKSHIMQLLCVYGIRDYDEECGKMVFREHFSENNEKRKELYREITNLEGSDETTEAKQLYAKYNSLGREISRESIKCKITLPEEMIKTMKGIAKKKNIHLADVCIALMLYETKKRWNYLKSIYIWGSNLLEDTSSVTVKIDVPKKLNEFLFSHAVEYGIGVKDYLLLLAEKQMAEETRKEHSGKPYYDSAFNS